MQHDVAPMVCLYEQQRAKALGKVQQLQQDWAARYGQ